MVDVFTEPRPADALRVVFVEDEEEDLNIGITPHSLAFALSRANARDPYLPNVTITHSNVLIPLLIERGRLKDRRWYFSVMLMVKWMCDEENVIQRFVRIWEAARQHLEPGEIWDFWCEVAKRCCSYVCRWENEGRDVGWWRPIQQLREASPRGHGGPHTSFDLEWQGGLWKWWSARAMIYGALGIPEEEYQDLSF